MDFDTIPDMGNNLRSLRENRKWKIGEAADRFGMSRGGYQKLERGERRLNSEYITKAAKVYGVPEHEIISSGEEVPIVGYVAAGAQANYFPKTEILGTAPMPENGTSQTVAVEVRGDSLGPLFNQWLVFYDEVRTPPTADLLGRLCVVGLIDERVMIKKLMRGSRAGHFHLLSANESPIEDAQLEWAARVKAMTPR